MTTALSEPEQITDEQQPQDQAALTLVDQLRQLDEQRHSATESERLELELIIDRADNPKPGDAPRLTELAAKLGVDVTLCRERAELAIERNRHRKDLTELQARVRTLRNEVTRLADAGRIARAVPAAQLEMLAMLGVVSVLGHLRPDLRDGLARKCGFRQTGPGGFQGPWTGPDSLIHGEGPKEIVRGYIALEAIRTEAAQALADAMLEENDKVQGRREAGRSAALDVMKLSEKNL